MQVVADFLRLEALGRRPFLPGKTAGQTISQIRRLDGPPHLLLVPRVRIDRGRLRGPRRVLVGLHVQKVLLQFLAETLLGLRVSQEVSHLLVFLELELHLVHCRQVVKVRLAVLAVEDEVGLRDDESRVGRVRLVGHVRQADVLARKHSN